MSSSIIEDCRQQAEDADLYERSLTQLLLSLETPALTHRDKLATSHRASDLLSRIVHRSDALLTALAPDNEERTREIDALTGQETGGDLAEFYQRLAKVKEYHRKYPDIAQVRVSGDREVDFAALEQGDDEWLDKRFTGEEGLGRYVDLHELHEMWNNLAPASSSGAANSGGWKRLTYLQYLAAVTQFSLSPSLKSSPEYSKYLTALLQYLSSFYEKVFPLGDLDEVLKKADQEFANAWEEGKVEGWAKPSEDGEKDISEGIWCAACEFLSLLADSSPLLTPTLLRSRTGQKMYSKESVYNAHLTSKKHVKAAAKLSTDAPAASASTSGPSSSSLADLRHQKNRALALKESLITALVAPPSGPLSTILSDTLSNTERRSALTDKERAVEIEELEAREAAEAAAAAAAAQAKAPQEDQEDEEERIYNPLKLPLGWDGKPIPFWLYKLHGLGVEYKCEICSDYVYMGRYVLFSCSPISRDHRADLALLLTAARYLSAISRSLDTLSACALSDCPTPSIFTRLPVSRMRSLVSITRLVRRDRPADLARTQSLRSSSRRESRSSRRAN